MKKLHDSKQTMAITTQVNTYKYLYSMTNS